MPGRKAKRVGLTKAQASQRVQQEGADDQTLPPPFEKSKAPPSHSNGRVAPSLFGLFRNSSARSFHFILTSTTSPHNPPPQISRGLNIVPFNPGHHQINNNPAIRPRRPFCIPTCAAVAAFSVSLADYRQLFRTQAPKRVLLPFIFFFAAEWRSFQQLTAARILFSFFLAVSSLPFIFVSF